MAITSTKEVAINIISMFVLNPLNLCFLEY